MDEKQIKSLGKLWMLFGNNGAMHTDGNHKFLQSLIEKGVETKEEATEAYKPTYILKVIVEGVLWTGK